jgi:alpha-L-fucosidase
MVKVREVLGMTYEPTLQSLRTHAVPGWYDDAKLGIFVHWGLYSVPGWAPAAGEYGDLIDREGWASWFAKNPYAEWYLNSIRIEDSPSRRHHVQTYGEEFSYDDFVPVFNEAIGAWNPGNWAELFRQAGAGYVVLTTKHHDGFLLWPSRTPNPVKEGYVASRDLVGELAEAVRARGMRMGLYYSGGLDWTFDETPLQDVVDLLTTVPQDTDYVEYANGHWRELIERYQPAVLWNDIGYPAGADLKALFADYYNQHPDGLVNDRWMQFKGSDSRVLQNRLVRALLSRLIRWALARGAAFPSSGHFDFRTPEYASFDKITPYKWEATRGIGYSFGYNRNEGADHCLSIEALVRSFVDIVSKNGNLLLNVGPMADGTIPALQRERLLGLGRWMEVNGEAVTGAHPWRRAEGKISEGIEVRFTRGGDALYAILLAKPQGTQVVIESLHAAAGCIITLLGDGHPLSWKQEGEHLAITLPDRLWDAPAYAIKLEPWTD